MTQPTEWSCPCCGKLQPVPEAARIIVDARLTGQQARIFLALSNAPGRAVSMDTLADCCWPQAADVPDFYRTTIQVQIFRLRKRIAGLGFIIEFAHPYGYRLLGGAR